MFEKLLSKVKRKNESKICTQKKDPMHFPRHICRHDDFVTSWMIRQIKDESLKHCSLLTVIDRVSSSVSVMTTKAVVCCGWIIRKKNQLHIEWFISVMVLGSSLKLFLGMCWWLSLLMCMIMNWCVKTPVLHFCLLPTLQFSFTVAIWKMKWKWDLKADHMAAMKKKSLVLHVLSEKPYF